MTSNNQRRLLLLLKLLVVYAVALSCQLVLLAQRAVMV